MSAMQRESKKTYAEMGDNDKMLIEVYCYEYGLSAKQAQDYIDWPWQSIGAHLKIMDDRLARKKDTLEHIQSRAKETIAKLGLTKPEIAPPAKKKEIRQYVAVDPSIDEPDVSVVAPEDCLKPVKQAPIIDELLPISTQPPFYMLALDDLIHQLRSNTISFRSLFVDDERGVLELRYKRSTT